MTEHSCFPIYLDDIFFVEMELKRQSKMPKGEVELEGQIKVFPRNVDGKLQVNVKLTTSKKDSNFYLNMEAVGLFIYEDETAENNLDLLTAFVNEHALFLIWAQFKAFLKILSVSMGMETFILPIPPGFGATKEALFLKDHGADNPPDKDGE